MPAVEKKLNMILGKNLHLFNSLNRSHNHPLINKYSHVQFHCLLINYIVSFFLEGINKMFLHLYLQLYLLFLYEYLSLSKSLAIKN